MNRIHCVLILVIVLAAGTLPAQNAGVAPNQGVGNAASQAAPGAATAGSVPNATAAAPIIRVLAPGAEAQLAQPFVAVRYELTNPGIAPSPNYRLQLDDRDPVVTTATNYTFTGLAPGKHTLSIELVDANNTPVAGARTEVTFTTAAAGAAPRGLAMDLQRPNPLLLSAAMKPPVVGLSRPLPERDPQPARGSLPLLSVVGFGALLGGIATAMKSR